jgi:hypothetical protein
MICDMLEVLKVLVPLVVGLFGGWIATRNARKTPHDTLKALVDIDDKLKDAGHRAVVEVSIGREIRKLERLNSSREEPFWKWAWIQVTTRGIGGPLSGLSLVSVGVIGAIAYDIYHRVDGTEASTTVQISAGVTASIALVAVVVAYIGYRLSKTLDTINSQTEEMLTQSEEMLAGTEALAAKLRGVARGTANEQRVHESEPKAKQGE